MSAEPSPNGSTAWTTPLPNVRSPTSVARPCSVERRGDDLRRARRVTVDEHDERQPRHRSAVCAEHLVHVMRARQRDDDAAVEEVRRNRDGLTEKTARIAAEIEHETLCARLLQPLDLVGDLESRVRTEAQQANVSPADARERQQPALDRGSMNEPPRDAHLHSLAPAPELELQRLVRRRLDARERLGRVDARDPVAADGDDHVALLHACAPRRTGLHRHDDETPRRRQHAHADSRIRRRRVALHELVARRRQVRRVRIAERRQHRVDRAEPEDVRGDRPVVARGERLAHLGDRSRDRHGRRRAVRAREEVAGRERDGENDDRRQDQRTPHQARGAYGPRRPVARPGGSGAA